VIHLLAPLVIGTVKGVLVEDVPSVGRVLLLDLALLPQLFRRGLVHERVVNIDALRGELLFPDVLFALPLQVTLLFLETSVSQTLLFVNDLFVVVCSGFIQLQLQSFQPFQLLSLFLLLAALELREIELALLRHVHHSLHLFACF
jgi:hypothetical protein